MAPIGVALIGGGIFVKEEHLPAVLACEHLALKAIFSRSLKSAQETAKLITTSNASPDLYSTDSGAGKAYQDLLGREDVSAVIIALPILAQPGYIEAALAAGKHVLAEKPIAPDVAGGEKLIEYYKNISAERGVTFGVAENFRYVPAYDYARKQVGGLGKITGFSANVGFLTPKDGNKWLETDWRKNPGHQGGFVLDAGVHFSAALRFLLGEEGAPSTLTAYTAQVQEYLPPVDTVRSVIKTKSGVIGTLSISVGTTLSAFEFGIACEKGSITATGWKVTVVRIVGGRQETHVEDFEETTGVKEEVRAWAESLIAGKADPLQAPEVALGDLELLEGIFRSGEQEGAPQKLRYQ